MKHRYYFIFFLIVIASLANAANRDNPSINVSDKEHSILSDYVRCMRGDWAEDKPEKEILDSAFYLLGKPYEKSPEQIVPAWFRFFSRQEFNGILTSIINISRKEGPYMSLTIERAQLKSKRVKRVAKLAPEIKRFIDLGKRSKNACNDKADMLIGIVDEQYDLAMSWVYAVDLATRNDIMWKNQKKKRKAVERAYRDLIDGRKSIEGMH